MAVLRATADQVRRIKAKVSVPKPALFLFDIDGTLLRAGHRVHKEAFGHAFRTVYGIDLDLSGVSAAGRTDSWLLAEPLRRVGLTDAQIRERRLYAFEVMAAYVERRLPDLHDNVLPGVPSLLERLDAEGQILGLLTGNLRLIALTKMRKAGLEKHLDTGGFGEESEVRAHLVPVALANASALSGETIPAQRTVIIGDTRLDIEAGQLSGTKTVGVATGPISVEELREAKPDLVLESLADWEASSRALLALQ